MKAEGRVTGARPFSIGKITEISAKMEGGIIKIVKNKHFFRRLTSGVSVEVVTLPPN